MENKNEVDVFRDTSVRYLGKKDVKSIYTALNEHRTCSMFICILSLHQLISDDIYYTGYANEVGEAFRSLVSKSLVWSSYIIASGYVLADTTHKGTKVYHVSEVYPLKYLLKLYVKTHLHMIVVD